jgi:hypothetical protein
VRAGRIEAPRHAAARGPCSRAADDGGYLEGEVHVRFLLVPAGAGMGR